jgi:UDP-N-acetylmuramate dehydrogenase
MIDIQENVSLTPFNTFGLAAKAKRFGVFRSIEELKEGLEAKGNDELLILGGGSNILLTQDFDGLVLKNELNGIEVVKEDNEHLWVKAMAGEDWHQFVLHCIAHDWAGIENMSLIPGTVGAAPMQNIGAYGVEIKDVFDELEALDKSTQTLRSFSNAECEFGYRESVFKKELKGQYVICSVTLKLRKEPVFNTSYGAIQETLEEMKISELSIKAVSDAVIKIRQSKLPDPAKIGNSGSFFKNPVIEGIDFEGLKAEFPNIPGYKLETGEVKVPAAWLIEQAGWKGKTFGQIGVHKKQPLVLVNYGDGNGRDIERLSQEIRSSVRKKFGIELTPEVNII